MKYFISAMMIAALLVVGAPLAAQGSSGDLGAALSRLKNNPRYQGRILGTHTVPKGDSFLYEVRILRRDDRVILVYIDPATGGVVGDSERQGARRATPQTRSNSTRRKKRRSR